MKTKVLFSALAVASLFAACNNEEVLTNEGNKQFENAELLGKGLSMSLAKDVAGTRVENGNWEAGDKAGLAWLVAGNNINATGELENVVDAPWANHMYTNKCGGDEWTTSSNIYKGWHFAYYPFAYQDGPKQLVFDVNAAPMKDKFLNDQYEALHISAADYPDANKIDENAGTITTPFRMERVVNILKPILNIDEAFTNHSELKTIKIKNIDIYSSEAVFQNKLKVVPSKLPTFVWEKGEPDKNATNAKFTDELIFGKDGALQVDGATAANHVITTIDETIADNYKLDGRKELRAFIAPVKKDASVNVNGLVIRVNVEGGYFDVALSDKVEANKNAIKKLYSLLSGEEDAINNPKKRNFTGVFYNVGTNENVEMVAQSAQKLELTLNKENFHADYTISNIEEWNAAVKMANALKETEVVFLLDGAVKFDSENPMSAPNAMVTVKAIPGSGTNAKLVFTAEKDKDNVYTWNNNIVNFDYWVTAEVEEGATLNVNGTKEEPITMGGFAIVNKGIINANGYASISTKVLKETNATGLDNSIGRIVVEYGAYVYPADGKNGVIAYNVTSAEPADIAKINTLMTTHDKGYASVNTLIVKTTLDINASATGKTEGDRYENSNGGTSLSNLNNINIELENGAIIKQKAGTNTMVKSLVAVSGVNTTTDVKIANPWNLDIEKGAELNVNSITTPKSALVLAYENDYAYRNGELCNYGTLNANTEIRCGILKNYGKITVAPGYKVKYFVSLEQTGENGEQGSFTGDVIKYGNK